MRIGINGSSLIALGRPASEIIDHAVAAEADGFDTYWVAQLSAPDALTVLGAAGAATSRIELGTAVVPTWLRHPLMLAAQALTTSDLSDGRLTLGIGLAHKPWVESTLRIPFHRPAQHMDEYLSVLLPAMQDRTVSFEGEIWSAGLEQMGGPGHAAAPSVLVAAMGPRMLELAGSRTDGTILWLSGPKTIETRIAPAVTQAARRAERPDPRIVASVTICVTDRPDEVRAMVAEVLANYNELPSYRGVMDTEGVAGPADVSLIGDEATVRAGIERFGEAGATDFSAVEFVTTDEEATRTRALLVDIHRA